MPVFDWQLANWKLAHVQPVSPALHAVPSLLVQSMPVYVAPQSVRPRQSASSLMFGQAGATSHDAYASHEPVQQPLLIVGTWPDGHCGAAVVQVTVPPQLPFGSVPAAQVPLSHQP